MGFVVPAELSPSESLARVGSWTSLVNQSDCSHKDFLPIGPKVVPFWDYLIEF